MQALAASCEPVFAMTEKEALDLSPRPAQSADRRPEGEGANIDRRLGPVKFSAQIFNSNPLKFLSTYESERIPICTG